MSIGDPGKVSTWSNVPYFFGKHMEQLGYSVHRVNIGPPKVLQVPYDLGKNAIKSMGFNSEHDYFRSSLNARLTQRRIDKALKAFPRSLPVFMTFSFGAGGSGKPYVLFGDRTFKHYLQYFNGRKPDDLELRNVKVEDMNLRDASMVISLFPDMAKELEKKFGNKVKYYGNVVNLPERYSATPSDLEEKWNAKQMLFIGKRHYMEGLIRAMEALKLLNTDREEPFHLHVIGVKERDVPGKGFENITFHGYLNKGDKKQYRRYVRLLEQCFLFVNPTPKWASFSASCEAMYFNIPLIIHAYPEFSSTFGDEQKECWFLPSERPEDLVKLIRSIASDREQWQMKAIAARQSVAPFTWQAFTSKVHEDIARFSALPA